MKILILLFLLTGCFGKSGGKESSSTDKSIDIDYNSIEIPKTNYLGFLDAQKEYNYTLYIKNNNDFKVNAFLKSSSNRMQISGCNTILANSTCSLNIKINSLQQSFSNLSINVEIENQKYSIPVQFASYYKNNFSEKIKYKILESESNGLWLSDLNHDLELSQYISDVIIDRFVIDQEENLLFDFIGFLSNSRDIFILDHNNQELDITNLDFYNYNWKKDSIPSSETVKGSYVKEMLPSFPYIQSKIRSNDQSLSDLSLSDINSFLEKIQSSSGNTSQGFYSHVMDKNQWEYDYNSTNYQEQFIKEKKLRDLILINKSLDYFNRNDLKEEFYKSIIYHLPRVTNSDPLLDNFEQELAITMDYNSPLTNLTTKANLHTPLITYLNSCKERALQMILLESIDQSVLSSFLISELEYNKEYLWFFLGNDYLNFDPDNFSDLLCLPYLLVLSEKTNILEDSLRINLDKALIDEYLSCSNFCIYDTFTEELTFLLEYSNLLDN